MLKGLITRMRNFFRRKEQKKTLPASQAGSPAELKVIRREEAPGRPEENLPVIVFKDPLAVENRCRKRYRRKRIARQSRRINRNRGSRLNYRRHRPYRAPVHREPTRVSTWRLAA